MSNNDPFFEDVRREVFARDHGVCTKCGRAAKLPVRWLVAERIDQWKSDTPDNLVTVCQTRKGGCDD